MVALAAGHLCHVLERRFVELLDHRHAVAAQCGAAVGPPRPTTWRCTPGAAAIFVASIVSPHVVWRPAESQGAA